MPKFAPKPGDTLHTRSKGDFICHAYDPTAKPWIIRGPAVYGYYASWDEDGKAYPRNGDPAWDITHITSKEQEMPKFAPKFGDTIHTADGGEFICALKPADFSLGYMGSTIYGKCGGSWQVWNDDGATINYEGRANEASTTRITGITPAALQPKPKFKPQPWDTIVTRNKGEWTCCTQEFLLQTFGLAEGVHSDPLFAFRPTNLGKGVTAVEWMSWPADIEGIPEPYEITAINQARCNRPAIAGSWGREALINYIKTLPERFVIGKDGIVE